MDERLRTDGDSNPGYRREGAMSPVTLINVRFVAESGRFSDKMRYRAAIIARRGR